MKIGIFTDIYYPYLNGVSVSVDSLAKELRKKGHTVYLFAPKVEGYKDVGDEVFRLSSARIIFSAPEVRLPIPTLNKSLRKLFMLDLDLIHAHGGGLFSLLGYEVAKIKGIPFILTFHGVLTEYMHYLFKGKIFKSRDAIRASRIFGNAADGIITPSEKMKDISIGYGIKKPITVIPNPVDTSAFGIPRKTFLHEKLNLSKDTPLILAVGRLGKEKNFAFTIEMFKKLAEKENASHLVIVGSGVEKEKLRELSGDLLNKRIHFAGRIEVKDMPLVYASAEVFVFTSTTETQGLCVLEAAAAGLPLVLTDDPAYENMIVDGFNGFSLPQKQDVFAEKLKELLKNKALRRKFGNNSKIIVAKNFNSQLLTEEMVTYYKKTLKSYKHNRVKNFNKKVRVVLSKTVKLVDELFEM